MRARLKWRDRRLGGTHGRHEGLRAGARRRGTSEEVADAILFLASSKASFLTRHPLAVDGGKLAG